MKRWFAKVIGQSSRSQKEKCFKEVGATSTEGFPRPVVLSPLFFP